jgi:hypothetical protein
MTITVTRLKRAAEELRDELTAERTAPAVDPLAMDILANRPNLLTRLAEKLSQRTGD